MNIKNKRLFSILLAAATATVAFSMPSLSTGSFDDRANTNQSSVNSKLTDNLSSEFSYAELTDKATTSSAEEIVKDGAKYRISGNYAILVSYTGQATTLTIPSSVGGYTVKKIGSRAFVSCSSLSSVIIPNSVTEIGSRAFVYCSSLSSITIPNSVTEIGEQAFTFCFALTNITVDTQNPKYSSTPDGVLLSKDKTVLLCCPSGNSGNYTVPNTVKVIGAEAFNFCGKLRKITIPSGVTDIDSESFLGCSSLNEIYVSKNNNYFCSEDNVLFTKDMKGLICCPAGRSGEYTVPSTVVNILDNAFYGCRLLTSITIPKGVKTIGYAAFHECKQIKEVNISNTVTSIGASAFFRCTSLTNITIPDSVTNLSGSAFDGCDDLKSITLSNKISTIGSFTFKECSALESITIPNSVTKIEIEAFDSCSSLTKVNLPKSLKNIGNGAFEKCEKLESVVIPNGTTSIGKAAFYNNPSLKTITIPNTVTDIGNQAFYKCTNLTIICGKNSFAERYAKDNGIPVIYDLTYNATISHIADQTYTGKTLTPSFEIKDGNTVLKNGTDYTAVYKNNVNIGTATITITGKGSYTGTKSFTFKIIAPTIAKPTNLNATQSTDSIKLSWNKANGADSYGVFIYDTKAKKYKNLATVTDTSYTVKNLKSGTTYKYAVRSNKKVGNKTFYSSNAVITTATKPDKVKNLKATQTADSVKLSWNKVNGATSYGVYRYDAKTKTYKGVATVTGTSYTDKKLKSGTTYKYLVRAKKVVGDLTFLSDKTYITTATKPDKVKSLKASTSKNSVKLSWSKVNGATSYGIYRYDVKTKTYKGVATVTGTGYTDKKLKSGTTYKYLVRAKKTVGSTTLLGDKTYITVATKR